MVNKYFILIHKVHFIIFAINPYDSVSCVLDTYYINIKSLFSKISKNNITVL